MSDIAISVKNLSKLYRIGAKEKRHDTISGAFAAWCKSPWTNYQRLRAQTRFEHSPGLRSPVLGPSYPVSGQSLYVGRQPSAVAEGSDLLWALKDVSFEVKQGEVIGIIGRNGAGKSTLLKVLSRITEPTSGRALINGRVASLLEVGTGFHPELTGRENIFLNGTILGMTKKEVDRKFDEIVEFAEIDKFIDTPVKHYSSGMHIRLAFAVAAHLEPEILLIDEVLAVGDSAFQKKCLGTMGAVAEGGRTVIFVSHQMNQIRRLCSKALWVDCGLVKHIGHTAEVVSAYELSSGRATSGMPLNSSDDRLAAHFCGWEIRYPKYSQSNMLTITGPVEFRFLLKVNKPVYRGRHGIALLDENSQLVWGTDSNGLDLDVGTHEIVYKLPSLPIRPGSYFWRLSLFADRQLIDMWDAIPELIVASKPVTHSRDEWAGILNLPYEFLVGRCLVPYEQIRSAKEILS